MAVRREGPNGFDEFVATRLQAVWRAAWLLSGDSGQAEGLAVAALGRARPHWERLAAEGSFEEYVGAHLVTAYLSLWRGGRRTSAHGGPVVELLEARVPEPSPDLAGRLRSLTRAQRAVVVLRYVEGFTEGQTADVLGCSVGTVKSRSAHALAALGFSTLQPEQDRLIEALRGMVPAPPDREWVREASRYAALARHRRRAVLATGAIALVAALVLPFLITGDSATPPARTGLLVDIFCRQPGGSFPLAEPAGDRVPDGPVRARLCAALPANRAPRDALTMRVDALVDTVNALPVAVSSAKDCPRAPDQIFDLAFQYPTGATVAIEGRLAGCDTTMRVGDSLRLHADRALQRYLELLAEQRAGRTPPEQPLFVSCGSPETLRPPSGAELDLVTGSLCFRDKGRGRLAEVVLEARQLARVTRDFRERSVADEEPRPSCRSTDASVEIVGQNRWGDVVRLSRQCTSYVDSGRSWLPSPEVAALIAELVTRAE